MKGMTSENALALALPNIIVISGIVISVMVWICRMRSAPDEKRTPMLLIGCAFIAFFIGFAISLGPNPKYLVSGRGGVASSGPLWGVLAGMLIAFILIYIARHYND
jgi:hypothetical protein